MKKATILFLVIVLLLVASCGGSGAAPASEHPHTATDWSVNNKNHWRSCPDCGEQYELAVHVIENNICSVCGAEVITDEQGAVWLTVYNSRGDCVLFALYTANGSEESRNEYEYSADGNKMTERSYYLNQLQYESVYDITDGNQIMLSNVSFYEDGSSEGCEYDSLGNEISYLAKDADGNVEVDKRYEHSYDADGNIVLTKTFENGRLINETEYINGSDEEGSWSRSGKITEYYEDGSKSVSDNDPDGAWSYVITYDDKGNITEELRYEYEYNENGDQTVGKGYLNGRLFQMSEGVYDENGETVEVIFTDINDDGSKQVRRYDNNFELIEKVDYDTNGNPIT